MRRTRVSASVLVSLLAGMFGVVWLASPAGSAPPAEPLVTTGVVVAVEGDDGSSRHELPLTLSAPSAVAVSVQWATVDALLPWVAAGDVDYVAASGTVVFAPGETTQSIVIEVVGDRVPEKGPLFGEWGLVSLSDPVNASLAPGLFGRLGLFVIIDDDARPPGCRIGHARVATSLPQRECDALVALYDSMDGPNWGKGDGWNTATDPCTWMSVVCSQGSVTGLRLGEAGLSGAVPAEIGDLTGLTVLDLEENLVVSLPPEIGNLSNLTRILMFDNRLVSLPAQIGDLSSLTVLDMSDNQLESLPPEIGNLANLERLTLWSNQLVDLPSQIGNLTNLTSLDAAMNPLESLPPEMANLTMLTELRLGGDWCLTVTDPDLMAWLDGLDPNWDEECG